MNVRILLGEAGIPISPAFGRLARSHRSFPRWWNRSRWGTPSCSSPQARHRRATRSHTGCSTQAYRSCFSPRVSIVRHDGRARVRVDLFAARRGRSRWPSDGGPPEAPRGPHRCRTSITNRCSPCMISVSAMSNPSGQRGPAFIDAQKHVAAGCEQWIAAMNTFERAFS